MPELDSVGRVMHQWSYTSERLEDLVATMSG